MCIFPGAPGRAGWARLRAVYAALAAKEIGYAYAAPGAEDGMQVIRPPEQVLWALKHATCLDLAVVLAGACLTAELHPVIVILDPASGTGVGHSLVLVRLDHDLQPRTDGLFDLDVWRQLPRSCATSSSTASTARTVRCWRSTRSRWRSPSGHPPPPGCTST